MARYVERCQDFLNAKVSDRSVVKPDKINDWLSKAKSQPLYSHRSKVAGELNLHRLITVHHQFWENNILAATLQFKRNADCKHLGRWPGAWFPRSGGCGRLAV